MANSGVAADKIQWYLIAERGDRVECVYPGMPLGETASGELSFSPYCAQLELDVDAEGGLILKPVGDYELTSHSGKDQPVRSESCHGRIEISLSRNVVQIDTDLVYPAPALRSLRVLSARQEPQSAVDAESDAEKDVSSSGQGSMKPSSPPRSAHRDNDDPFAALLSGKRPKPPAKAAEIAQPAPSSEPHPAQTLTTPPDEAASPAGKREPDSAGEDHGSAATDGTHEPKPDERSEPAVEPAVPVQSFVDVRQVFTVLPEAELSLEQISDAAATVPASATGEKRLKPTDNDSQKAAQAEEPAVSVSAHTPEPGSTDATEITAKVKEAGKTNPQRHQIRAEAHAAPVPAASEAGKAAGVDRQQANTNPTGDEHKTNSREERKRSQPAVSLDGKRAAAEPETPPARVETQVAATVRPAGDGAAPSVRSKTPAMIALTAIGAALLYILSNDAPILEQPDALMDTATVPVVEPAVEPAIAGTDSVIVPADQPQRDPGSNLIGNGGGETQSNSGLQSSEFDQTDTAQSQPPITAPAQPIAEISTPQESQQIAPSRSENVSVDELPEPRAADTSVSTIGTADASRSEPALADEADEAATRLIAAGQVSGSAGSASVPVDTESVAAAAERPVAVAVPSTRTAGGSDENVEVALTSESASAGDRSESSTGQQPAAAAATDTVALADVRAPGQTAAAGSIDTPRSAEEIEQARRRALVAADRALAQGRLVRPTEASAYALYNRVLSLDPDSMEAQNGIRSVRQGLINRALAQLASGALADARDSLQSAEEIGANPMLIGDLRNEVGVREQQLQARPEGPQGGGQ